MSNNTTTHNTKVKINKEDYKVNLTIDWEGMTNEQMRELAARAIIVRWQNDTRTNETIPETNTTISATEYALGRPRHVDPMKALDKLSDEQLAELLKKRGLL